VSVLNVLTLVINDTQSAADDDKTIDRSALYNAAVMFFAVSVASIAICVGMS
jgi:hypothetical protein